MIDFPQPERIATNGVELEVFSAGAGRPVVLCHGWPELAYSWRYQVPAFAAAGYRVLAPNQRGYGRSSRPRDVAAYDIVHLTGDLTGLLDHYGYENALFVGHDWGAIVVWALALLHPARTPGVINLSVPFLERGTREWIGLWEERGGGNFYIVHFNRQPGVADAVFDADVQRFLNNLYRAGQWNEPVPDLGPGMMLINLAQTDNPPGAPIMSDEELQVFVKAFEHSGFTGGINWYRNFTRNWEILGDYEQRVEQPALAIFGKYDMVRRSGNLADFVPNVQIAELDCGHWIQQERPEETTRLMLDWMARNYPA